MYLYIYIWHCIYCYYYKYIICVWFPVLSLGTHTPFPDLTYMFLGGLVWWAGQQPFTQNCFQHQQPIPTQSSCNELLTNGMMPLMTMHFWWIMRAGSKCAHVLTNIGTWVGAQAAQRIHIQSWSGPVLCISGHLKFSNAGYVHSLISCFDNCQVCRSILMHMWAHGIERHDVAMDGPKDTQFKCLDVAVIPSFESKFSVNRWCLDPNNWAIPRYP